MKLTPRGYQYAGSRFLSGRSAILGYRVGLGKTLTALLAVEEANAHKVLIISPKTLKPWWASELENFYDNDEVITTDLGYNLWRVEVYRDDRLHKQFFLAHYEQFINRSKIVERLLAIKWDAVVADEVHRIKNRRAQRTKNINKLNSKFKWGLTGTPVADKPEDLWSLLHWVAPKVWTSYWRFVNDFCEMEYNPFSRTKQPSGFKMVGGSTDAALQLLQQRTAPYLLVKSLEDVGVELPPVVHTTVPLEMADKQRKFYNKVQADIMVELATELEGSKGFANFALDLSGGTRHLIIKSAGARFVRLQQVASAPTVFTEGVDRAVKLDNVKLDWLKDYVEDGGQPALILTRFNHTVAVIQALLTELGAEGFIVGTWAKLSEGHNFQHLSTMIAWDLPLYLLEWTQGLGRLDRPGQKADKVHVIRLCAVNTVDEKLIDLIDGKYDTAEMLVRWLRGVMDAN